MLKNGEIAIIEFKKGLFKKGKAGYILNGNPNDIFSGVFVDYYRKLNNTVIQIEKREHNLLFLSECYKAINFYNKQPILIPVPVELIKKVNK